MDDHGDDDKCPCELCKATRESRGNIREFIASLSLDAETERHARYMATAVTDALMTCAQEISEITGLRARKVMQAVSPALRIARVSNQQAMAAAEAVGLGLGEGETE